MNTYKNRKINLKVIADDDCFLVCDDVFYDYGVGDSLKKAFDDYLRTIKERVEIVESPHYYTNETQKLETLKTFLSKYPKRKK